ncbi:hypothetical protein [Aeromonas caviae]|uniref:hypothetical protein n=1 Tax=Aeromonas caviae TaxID=648 RepID=UPI002B48D7E2|nr:hypothetical protein [Aeromonas caviae]
MTSFYKTTDPAALAVYGEVKAAKEAVIAQGKKMGEEFGGKPVFGNSVDRATFAGLVLNDYYGRADRALWTVPDKRNGRSWPRSGKVRGMQDEQKVLLEKYYSMHPDEVRNDPIWEAMGINSGELLFGGCHMFDAGGAIYLKTSAKVGPKMTEIMGSEFSEAYAEYNKQLEAA